MTTKLPAHRRTVIMMLRLTPTELKVLKKAKRPSESLAETARRLMFLNTGASHV